MVIYMKKIIPILNKTQNIKELYLLFTKDLEKNNFQGDISKDYASRVSSSIDNSIYAVIPEVVIFPKDTKDIEKIFLLANKEKYSDIKFSPRGAGTGTNGQSLSHGIIIDTSRHMNNIIEVNLKDKYVIVQPGVVLDQLNEALEDSEYFFAPNLSPANRATIGGMVNTDACGKGSKIYGRTSQHILELECILSNGDILQTKKISLDELKNSNLTNIEKDIYQTVDEHIIKKYEKIENTLPKLDRFLTGYNLAKAYDKNDNSVNLSYIISGSEGTLVLVSQLKLKLTKKPKYKSLFAISYDDFNKALKEAKNLISYKPSAIETVDNNIVNLAKKDVIYPEIKHMLEKNNDINIAAVNLVEFIAQDQTDLDDKVAKLERYLLDHKAIFHLTEIEEEMNSLWDLRKKGVGLLGAMKGRKKPVPFMEDTAVPPENLASYIKEVTNLLDSYGVKYGMFGHVDVGCLHVRPALDMTTKEDMQKVIQLTKEVNQLVKKYGGVYWSEHGKGFRSEYVKEYFGDELYQSLEHIKNAFDPKNQLNPGKIAVPYGSEEKLVKVDGPFRGYDDASVNKSLKEDFSGAFNCNGNSQCLNYSLKSVMCPSAKVSRNWKYSPKGRSAILREWTKQLSKENYTSVNNSTDLGQGLENPKNIKNDFSHEVYDSLDKCLGCKACATACPIKVNIPHMKSLFLANYHTRYKRPLADYFVKNSEELLYNFSTKLPTFSKLIINSSLTNRILDKFIGFVDSPKINTLNLQQELQKRNAPIFNIDKLRRLTVQEKEKTICIVQDIFTSVYDTNIAIDLYDFLTNLGYTVYFAPFKVNGKPAHVKGFINYFKKKAIQATNLYSEIAELDISMIGIDPAMTLVYRDEYSKILESTTSINFKIYMIQEWLFKELNKFDNLPKISTKEYTLFAHCTEKSLSAISLLHWQKIFSKFGLKLKIARVGCCGMSGSFGHEKRHSKVSKEIYNLSWKEEINKSGLDNSLATGFSCRCQVKRIENTIIKHPIEILQKILN